MLFREKKYISVISHKKNKEERICRSLPKVPKQDPPNDCAAHPGRVSQDIFILLGSGKRRSRQSRSLAVRQAGDQRRRFILRPDRICRGSMTLEAALAMPLFLFAVIAMISIMDLYRVQTEHLTNLCQTAKAAAAFTYTPGGGGISDIVLPDYYSFRPVGIMLDIPGVSRLIVVKVRSWNGKEHISKSGGQPSEPMVYVTETGTVFHRSLGCSYLNLSVTHMPSSSLSTARNQYGGKYLPCEICARTGIPAPLVYVTKKGDRYHNLDSCSGLKRSVRLVKESEVRGMRACSRCG